MAILPVNGKTPKIAPDVFIAEGAQIIGDVTIGAGSSIWYNAVLRGDMDTIVIGERTSIQDNCTIHVDKNEPTYVGNDCVVGHAATIHGAHVGNGCLIGMGAVVLGANVGDETIIAASAMVPNGREIPPRSMVMGVPAKVMRSLTEDEVESIRQGARNYEENRRVHIAASGGQRPPG